MAHKKAVHKSSHSSGKTENANARVATDIQGFDKLCSGGFVSNSMNLVVGNAGAGKTTFGLQFLYNGAKKGENGVYVSLEPEVEDLKRGAKKQGMDFESVKDKVEFIKFTPDMAFRDMTSRIAAAVKKNHAKRVVLDSINVIALELPTEGANNQRKRMYEIFGSLKPLGICLVLLGEAEEEGSEGQKMESEVTFAKFMSDSVVELYSSGLGGSGDRAVRIAKMRESEHERGPVGMKITDKGIVVLK